MSNVLETIDIKDYGMPESNTSIKTALPKKQYKYETDPKRRKYVRKVLIKRLQKLLDEYLSRIGQQVSVVTFSPSDNIVQVYGAEPLKRIIELHSPLIAQAYSAALNCAMTRKPSNQILPELKINGEQKTIDQLTQANLRSFIPLMLKYATGRGKPGWGKPEMKPEWWPEVAPWANIRADIRTDEEKEEIPWKTVLKEIIRSCYRYYNEEKYLYVENDVKSEIIVPAIQWTNESYNGEPIPHFYVPPLSETNDNPKTIFDLTPVVNYCQENRIETFIIQTESGDDLRMNVT